MTGSGTLPDYSDLGELREVLSAVLNLEQLLGSVHVGPKLLAGVVPDVRALCGAAAGHVAVLVRRAEAEGGYVESLEPLTHYARSTFEQLGVALAEAARTALQARARLALEDAVSRLAPRVARIVDHVELVLSAATTDGMELPLAELLSSRPEHGSARPFRPFPVFGPAGKVQLTLPPRLAVRALSLLAESAHLSPASVLLTLSPDDELGLEFLPAEDERLSGRRAELVAALPVMGALPASTAAALAVLRRYGARVEPTLPTALWFPCRVTG